MKSIVLLLSALALSGCAASGKLYSENAWDAEIQQPNQSRVTVFRTQATIVASARDALVTLDSRPSKYCAYGGYATLDIAAGKYVLNVGMTEDKYLCAISVELKPGEEQFFEIKPNTDLIMGEAISGGLAAGLASKGVYGAGGGGGGKAANCASYFSVAPVDRAYALKQLATIRESKQ
jgi:hypothetical protein